VFAALMASLCLTAGALAGAAFAAPNLRVRGNQLLDGPGRGHPVTLRGINRSGLEYACIQGWGFFDSPHPGQIDDPSMIAAIKSWHINAVRVPLNEACWLGIGTNPRYGGAPYRRIVQSYVRALGGAGLYVILDLHWAAPNGSRATGLIPMADSDHAPAFWRSVATAFKNNHALIFDLFNEPFGIDWACWLQGCQVPAGGGLPSYRAAGMQAMVDAVRSAGATQPLLLGGLNFSSTLAGWSTHLPKDPLHALVASAHSYGGLDPCDPGCMAAVLSAHARHPVLFGELGETDCLHGYIDSMMSFADAHGIGYLGWAWDAVAPGTWSCSGGPSLILDYKGTPTPYGAGLRNHLRALVRASKSS
jgi:endoglucanase